MSKTIEELINLGKKTAFGLSFLIMTSCYHGAWGPVRAKQDYGKYPECKKEIAFHNIKQILTDAGVCQDPVVNEGWFSCRSKGPCLKWASSYSRQGYNPADRAVNIIQTTACSKRAGAYILTDWPDIKSVDVEGTCLSFNFSPECSIFTRDSQQARELKEAIEIYLEK